MGFHDWFRLFLEEKKFSRYFFNVKKMKSHIHE